MTAVVIDLSAARASLRELRAAARARSFLQPTIRDLLPDERAAARRRAQAAVDALKREIAEASLGAVGESRRGNPC